MNRYLFGIAGGMAIAALVPWHFIIPEPNRAAPTNPLDDGLCIKQGSPYLHLHQIHGTCPDGLTYRSVPEGPPDMQEVIQ